MKVAFITGVTGQDGAYLSEFFIKERLPSSRNEKKIFFIQH